MNEKRELLSCDQRLTRLILQFNYLPASYLHPSQRAVFLPGLPFKVWEIPRAWRHLSEVILRDSQLTMPFLDARHWGWTIALLPLDRITQLILHVGAVALREHVRSSLAREHVLNWKQRLGNDAYRFAMTSASLMPAASLSSIEVTNCAPDQIGYQVLEAAIESMPESMCRRVQLKIPRIFDPMPIESAKARRIIASILDITETKWCSSIVASQR